MPAVSGKRGAPAGPARRTRSRCFRRRRGHSRIPRSKCTRRLMVRTRAGVPPGHGTTAIVRRHARHRARARRRPSPAGAASGPASRSGSQARSQRRRRSGPQACRDRRAPVPGRRRRRSRPWAIARHSWRSHRVVQLGTAPCRSCRSRLADVPREEALAVQWRRREARAPAPRSRSTKTHSFDEYASPASLLMNPRPLAGTEAALDVPERRGRRVPRRVDEPHVDGLHHRRVEPSGPRGKSLRVLWTRDPSGAQVRQERVARDLCPAAWYVATSPESPAA